MSATAADIKREADLRKETEVGKDVDSPEGGVICVLDMGEQSRKRIRRLRRGEGKLMGKVENAIGDLQNQGVLGKQVQTVVVVVREEFGLRNIFGSDDDDDDDD
jgi:hypothetical protein